MGEAFCKRGAGGSSLNIRLKTYSSAEALPEKGDSNTIAVITTQGIPAQSFSPNNPYLRNQTKDLLLGKTRSKGYIESDNSIGSQWTEDTEDGRAAFEVYTKDYITVVPGEYYTINYTCPTGDWNWMRILEYNSGKGLIAEWIMVDEDLNGKTFTTPYNPGDDVKYVRLTWYTYNDPNTLVELVDNNNVYTDETVELGTVWVQLGESSSVPFVFGKRSPLEVHPIRVYQYTAVNTWTYRTAYAYSLEAADWRRMCISLYRKGNECVGMTGGWVPQSFGNENWYPGTFRKEADSMFLGTYNAANCNVSVTTKNPIDFNDATTIYIRVTQRTGQTNTSTGTRGAWLYLSEYPDCEADQTDSSYKVGISSAKVFSLTISKANGIFYPRVTCYGATISIDEIYYY